MSVTRPRPVIPEELPKLLHDLSYAVIKNNPNDIISFAADFFQQLYDERKKPEESSAAAIVRIEMDDENASDSDKRDDMQDEQ